MESWERFSVTALPDKETFYSKLNDKHISDEEYAHAQYGAPFVSKLFIDVLLYPVYSVYYI